MSQACKVHKSALSFLVRPSVGWSVCRTFPFRAAAPEGQMTYDSTQGDFLRFPVFGFQYTPPPSLKSGISDPKLDLSDP